MRALARSAIARLRRDDRLFAGAGGLVAVYFAGQLLRALLVQP